MTKFIALLSKISVVLLLVSVLPAHCNENVFMVADDQDATPYIFANFLKKPRSVYGIEWSPNLSSVCKMLAAHRGDVFLQDEAMVRYAIKNIKKSKGNTNQNYDCIIAIDAPVPDISFHLLVRKDSSYLYLLPQFDAAIRAIHKDGDFAKITHKWLQ